MRTTKAHLLILVLAVGCSAVADASPGTPVLTITTPDNQLITLPANRQLAVAFTTNWTLMAPGSCIVATCGHLHVLIDGGACTMSGSPYGTATASPALADFSQCSASSGTHVITLELLHDNDMPVTDLVGNAVTAHINVMTFP
jgi:hypothetical protein